VKRFFKSKWFKIPFYTLTFAFAAIGFFLTVSYAAIQMGWTKEGGIVDSNNRYFQEMQDKYNQDFKVDSATMVQKRYEAMERIIVLNEFYPQNAQYILSVLQKGTDSYEVIRMLDAVDLQLKENKSYQKALSKIKFNAKRTKEVTTLSAFEWMNIAEWKTFKEAVSKDRKLIDSVANQTGVEGRLIVSCLVGEQIRLFNSSREAYKKWIGPLKVLSVESQFSFGVTGIKELTAKNIEQNLKDPGSIYYLGSQYEGLLDFQGQDTATINKERIDRLTDFHNHYYSYMYAALFLKQVKVQWEKAGFPIDKRPEILATLFNVGYPQSKPKSNPRVGGSTIQIYEKPYSFGAIAYQFYYSGELFDLFPFEKKKFDWNEKT
jgi:coenzyme F420-reducing hydrogenase delta subunit